MYPSDAVVTRDEGSRDFSVPLSVRDGRKISDPPNRFSKRACDLAVFSNVNRLKRKRFDLTTFSRFSRFSLILEPISPLFYDEIVDVGSNSGRLPRKVPKNYHYRIGYVDTLRIFSSPLHPPPPPVCVFPVIPKGDALRRIIFLFSAA